MSAVLEILSWICLVSGAIFCVIGGIGILRLPDFYTRTHAASITDTIGAGLVLAGLFFAGVDMMFDENMNWVPDMWLVPVKILFLGLFILLTCPTAGHALVKAAYAHGLCAIGDEDETDSDTVTVAGTGTDTVTVTVTEAVTVTDSDTDTDSDTGAVTDSDTEAEADSDTEAVADSDTPADGERA